MLTKVRTATLSGIEGYPVTVETDLHSGLPGFHIVGLADTTIKEASKRIKPAIQNCGGSFPGEKVTVNLVPAGRPKEGSHFDLPIALGIMMLGSDVIELEDTAFIGEVSLDGTINGIRGALPLAICLRQAGIKNLVLPLENAAEASILEDINILPVEHLKEAAEYVSGIRKLPLYIRKENEREYEESSIDFAQVIGQESVKRAILVGAAGNHGILMMGSPGCGKTMMARRIPGILPELTYEEKVEITGIYSVAGLLSPEHPIVNQRPFRSPHHNITQTGLIGGGVRPRPGELSLAHRGVLFLDELGEFDARVIDSMRQPVEEGIIRINRNLEEAIFPSKVMMVIAANPCKCGNLWDSRKICTCSAHQLEGYRRKLMGPFADRVDIHIKVNPVEKDNLMMYGNGMSTAEMRKIVCRARALQAERYKDETFRCNGQLDEKGIRKYCSLGKESKELMMASYDRLGLSMRGYSKILRMARTIADLSESDRIETEHVAEALMYRVDLETR
ncbi:MAG: ATP-binding protein [Clostridiales bacterium]|nr:ATP-binding protein [Clostridiales bacterium]